MRQNLIVWDLETVADPNLREPARSTGSDERLDPSPPVETFPRQLYHKIICVGTLIASREKEAWIVRSVGAPTLQDETEPALIQAFVDKVAALKAKLVTFNGSSFDFPVLRYRAMLHHLSAPALSERPYFNRYSDDSVDLCDVLAAFDGRNKISLQEISTALGFDGKPTGIDGSQVAKLFKANKFEEISSYCKADVINTYRVWLRYELFRGSLSVSGYESSESSLAEFVDQHLAPPLPIK